MKVQRCSDNAWVSVSVRNGRQLVAIRTTQWGYSFVVWDEETQSHSIYLVGPNGQHANSDNDLLFD